MYSNVYLPESFAETARQWQRRLLSESVSLVVPSLHYWEFTNVLRTYVRRGELGRDLALETYELHLDAPLEIEEPDRRVVFEHALRYEATVYDAVYIALSIELDVPLLTAEKSTTPWVSRLGDRVEPVRP